MNNNTQSRPFTTQLVGLAIAASVGVVGCSRPTTTSALSVGETSSSVAARALVDVEGVWASHPMPDCPRVVIGNTSAPASLELPSNETVAEVLRGVRSPAPEGWVRGKLGWVAKWLAKVRADIVSDPGSAGSNAEKETFKSYVKHVSDELRAGENHLDSTDSIYPEGCS